MEVICEDLKTLFITDLPALLTKAETAKVTLPAFTEKNITIGHVDLQKNNGAQELFIIPDRQSLSEISLSSFEAFTPVEVLIVVRRADPDILYRQSLRYAAAIKKMCNSSPENGVRVSEIEFFEEVEGLKDVKAVSLTLEVTTEEMMEE